MSEQKNDLYKLGDRYFGDDKSHYSSTLNRQNITQWLKDKILTFFTALLFLTTCIALLYDTNLEDWKVWVIVWLVYYSCVHLAESRRRKVQEKAEKKAEKKANSILDDKPIHSNPYLNDGKKYSINEIRRWHKRYMGKEWIAIACAIFIFAVVSLVLIFFSRKYLPGLDEGWNLVAGLLVAYFVCHNVNGDY